MRKRYLKTFENLDEYNSQKIKVMGIPHVVLLEDVDEVVFDSFVTNYFTLEVLEDGTISLTKPYDMTSMSYLINNGDWTELTTNTNLHLSKYDTVRIKGYGTSYQCAGLSFITTSEPLFNVYGNIMSLIYGDDFKDKKSLEGTENCFKGLLCDTKVVDASNLILPATTLTSQCYNGMFVGCTNLTTAPVLPATTLAEQCYENMFSGCTSLTTAPQLPATTLANRCYRHMFNGCSGLTSAPALPAEILAGDCYAAMFSGCTSLTTAPALPATTLVSSCYSHMFDSCTNLTTAPALPATTLVINCYGYMFYKCTSLTTAPALPATILATNCYTYMFEGCSNLNYIKMLATNISASGCLKNWVSGVASSGTFVKHPQMTSLPNGVNGIPNGWTVENYEG